MINYTQLFIGILFGSFAQALTFIQLQGQLKFDILKNHFWIGVLMGIPISILFMYSVKNLVLAFNGELWPSRLIGFTIGTLVFSILSKVVFQEPLTLKTEVCLILSLLIFVIQLTWK